jgi:hypothetical protein
VVTAGDACSFGLYNCLERMKRLALIAAAALGVVSGASAKAPPDGFRVCGAASCVPITGMDAEILAINMFYGAGTKVTVAPSPAPFYTLHWTSAQNGAQATGYYVPSANATVTTAARAPSVSPGWSGLSADAQTRLARLTAGLDPFAAATPTRVVIGGKAVRDPASYSVLWTAGWHAYAWPSNWLSVRVFTTLPSPWQGSLLLARRRSLIERDGDVYAIPARLAARMRAHASLR